MIAVIADDFTGAAEIGGIGIRYGFDVTIDTRVRDNVHTDILVIATDTRSQRAEDAEVQIEIITAGLLALKPDLIYKKVDSILRGNVAEELLVQLRVSSKDRVLLIPANPHLRRVIKEGIYYYNEMPLSEFDFTNGASHKKRNSSHVLDLIADKARSVTTVISQDDDLAENGLMIGNTSDAADLHQWAGKIDSKTLPAGASGFFDAILQSVTEAVAPKQKPLNLGQKLIYVCGSAFKSSKDVVRSARDAGQPVIYMPAEMFSGNVLDATLLSDWTEEISDCLRIKNKVILAVEEVNDNNVTELPAKIRTCMATAIQNIMNGMQVDELIVEGGATAHAIIQKLGYTQFYPTHELGPGTIRMRVEEKKDVFLTLKPGSYAWPEQIWQY